MPVIFSEVDKRALFFANNHLWKTVDGGAHWKQLSPDLTRQTWTVPASVGKYASDPSAQPAPRGVIYTVAPSYQDINRIWVGTDDGLIHVTADSGVTWKDVTPPGIGPWAKVSVMDAGRFAPLTAYAAINTLRLDDLRPHIFRTHDGGKTWTEIVNGIPNGETVNAVREDPKRKGLLFAGTERAVYVSFDDGANWQSLRLNMAVSSVRDLIVKDDDLVAATHGRGFWILDDITPLRQVDAASASSGRDPVQADDRVAGAVEHERRHAVAERGADGAESSRGRAHQLLPEVGGERSGHARDPAAGWPAGAPLLEQRSRRRHSRCRRRARSGVLVPDAAAVVHRRRHASLRVGRALPAARGPASRARARSARCRRSCRFRRFPSTPFRRRRRPGSTPARTW